MENDIAEMIRRGLAADGAERRKREAEEEARREAEKITIRMSPGQAKSLYNALVFVRANPTKTPGWVETHAFRDMEELIEAETDFDLSRTWEWQKERGARPRNRR